jgi:hypothetical protein
MARSFCDATLLAYPVLPLEIDLTADGTSHSRDFKSQTFRSVTSSHLYIRSECCSFDQDLRSMTRSFCGATLLAYPVLPLEIDPTADETSHSGDFKSQTFLSVNSSHI